MHTAIDPATRATRLDGADGTGTLELEIRDAQEERVSAELDPANYRILVVDDDASVADSHAQLLGDLGYPVVVETRPQQVMERLAEAEFSAVLLDVRMPGLTGLELLTLIKTRYPQIGVIMATVVNDIEAAVRATKAGAYNYLLKPLQRDRLARVLSSYLLNRPVFSHDDARLRSFITQAPVFEGIFRRVRSFAEAGVPVLIQGETGTGKEIIARIIHNLSDRSAERFTAVNAASFSAELFEAELFGHSKGAYTGAHRDQPGYFEEAAKGTLFLDEIGELSREHQKKLLRVLQTGLFSRVGETRERKLEARLILATNRNLAEDIQTDEFRADLFFRFSAHIISLPPLRERPGDVKALAEYFLEKYSSQYGRQFQSIAPEAIALLDAYSFPGNVRELEGMISAAVLIEQGPVISADSLPDHLALNARASAASQDAPVEAAGSTLEDLKYAAIMSALAECNGNQTLAAKKLGIARGTLNRLLQSYRSRERNKQ